MAAPMHTSFYDAQAGRKFQEAMAHAANRLEACLDDAFACIKSACMWSLLAVPDPVASIPRPPAEAYALPLTGPAASTRSMI